MRDRKIAIGDHFHKTHTIGDHFKYKDKQAHLERSNVVYKLECSCGHSYIGQTQEI